MLEAFAEYEQSKRTQIRGDHNTIAVPLGTRLLRMIRLPHGWRLWLSTNDFIYGTYLELFDDGRILRVTARQDEGDEMFWVRMED
jgi:hypothetical protein